MMERMGEWVGWEELLHLAEDTEHHGESNALAGEGGCLTTTTTNSLPDCLQPLSEPAPVSWAGWHLASAAACCLSALLVLTDH